MLSLPKFGISVITALNLAFPAFLAASQCCEIPPGVGCFATSNPNACVFLPQDCSYTDCSKICPNGDLGCIIAQPSDLGNSCSPAVACYMKETCNCKPNPGTCVFDYDCKSGEACVSGSCKSKCTSNGCETTTCTTATCNDGCGNTLAGTKNCSCTPNNCQATTCTTATCNDGCGNTLAGTKNCSCTPNNCQATTCTTATCNDGCGNTLRGTLTCAPIPVGSINVPGCASPLAVGKTSCVSSGGITWSTSNTATAGVWVNDGTTTSLLACSLTNPSPAPTFTFRSGVNYVFSLYSSPCTPAPTGILLASQPQKAGNAIGSCGPANTICGVIKSQENNAPLSNILVQLRNSNSGKVIATQQSAATTGQYAFLGLTPNQSYEVTVAVDRNQAASPTQQSVYPTQNADFLIRGVPAIIKFQGLKTGTYVLVTPTVQYPSASAPPPTKRSGASVNQYSQVASADGTAVVDVPGGTNYWYTCWLPPENNQTTYTRTANAQVPDSGGGVLSLHAKDSIGPLTCP